MAIRPKDDANVETSVVTYLWCDSNFSDDRGFRPQHVNLLAKKVNQYLTKPHRFICITDETSGFSSSIELLPIPKEAQPAALLPTVEAKKRFPSCYRRLWTFSKTAEQLGDVVLVLDVDCMILKPLDPLFDYLPDSDFVGWNPRQAWGETKIGGGTWRLRTGTKTNVWEEFSYKTAEKIRAKGFRGSDQAILSYYLGNEPVFPQGWISNSQDMRRTGGGKPPKGTLIQHFNGRQQYWDLDHLDWVKEYLNE